MIQDSLQLAPNGITIFVGAETSSVERVDVWMIIAIVELLIILILLLSRRVPKATMAHQQIKEQVLKEQIDFGNIVKSGFGAVELYDKLKIVVHPDRFPNDEAKQKIATELMQLTVKNKHNLKFLEEVRVRARNELNLNI